MDDLNENIWRLRINDGFKSLAERVCFGKSSHAVRADVVQIYGFDDVTMSGTMLSYRTRKQ